MISKVFRKILRIFLTPFIRANLFDYSKLRTLISLDKNYLSNEETSNYIYDSLKKDGPLMISRF